MSDIFQREDIRKAFWIPCESKEQLHSWIDLYLGLDIPDCLIDEDSTASAMDVIWEVYSACMNNDREDLSRLLAYAARDSFKTVLASALEVLALVHMERNCCHLAAITAQSAKAQSYVKKSFARPILRDFVSTQNERRIEIVRYYDPSSGNYLTQAQFDEVPEASRAGIIRKDNYIQIVVATLAGTNSEHVSFMCVAGDTKILIKQKGTSLDKTKRKRGARTARGLFKRLAGLPPGGRTGGEDTLRITSPVEQIEALSLNMATGQLELKLITGAYRQKKKLMRVVMSDSNILECTQDEPIYVHGRGFVQLQDIHPGDKVLNIGKTKLDVHYAGLEQTKHYEPYSGAGIVYDPWEQVILGTLLGDGGIYKKPTNNPYICENHCLVQKEYMEWKRSIIHNKLRTRDNKCARSGYTGEPMCGYATGNSPLLLPWVDFRKNLNGVERLGPQGLAVWYQDDGCKGNGFRISSESFTREQNQRLVEVLKNNFGIESEVCEVHKEEKKYYCIRGGVEAKRRLVEVCKDYIHPTMAYKFDVTANQKQCRRCGSSFWFYEEGNMTLVCSSPICRRLEYGMRLVKVVSVQELKEDWVYDFTVEGNNNFFANGVLLKNCIDEVDVIQNPRAYAEAALIPSPWQGKLPITLLISTRKTSFGLVQQEIDKAPQTGLALRHWNLIDVTEACPPKRYKPDDPRVNLWRSDSELRHVSESDYELMDEKLKDKFVLHQNAYAGCAKCHIFSSCKGRLVTKQKSTSPLLKPITHTIQTFRKVDIEMAQAQLMCRKAAATGLVYPRANGDIHLLTAAQIASKITGEEFSEDYGKADLITLMINNGLAFWAGMDWGFSHLFAVASGAVQGQNIYIFDVIAQAGLDPEEKLWHAERIKLWNPTIFADPESPDQIKLFKKKGFNMRAWQKGPGSVKMGIDIVRMKLNPAIGDPQIFFLRGDPQCELAFEHLSKYHFVFDATGEPTDVPSDENDDICDSIRYLCLNLFTPKGKITSVQDEQTQLPQLTSHTSVPPGQQPTENNYLSYFINQNLSEPNAAPDAPSADPAKRIGKKGRVLWNF